MGTTAQALIKLHNHFNDKSLQGSYLTELQHLHTNIENTIFSVGVFGYFGVGKSTLINRMLGEQNLLPVDEEWRRLDPQRKGGYRSAAVRSRAQADHLRRKVHQAVVLVTGLVMERDAYGHEQSAG